MALINLLERRMPFFHKALRWGEMLLLFGVLPSLYYFKILKIHFIILLVVLSAGAALYLYLNPRFSKKAFGLNGFKNWLPVLSLLFAFTAVSTVAVWYTDPASLFILPREKPMLWIAILIFYPVFSAYPQELLFRGFFIERYRHLFKYQWMLILFNGALFGIAHLMFGHWVSVLLSAIGGMLFAWLYIRHRSFLLTAIVHGLYGNWLFTVGLGKYFFIQHGY